MADDLLFAPGCCRWPAGLFAGGPCFQMVGPLAKVPSGLVSVSRQLATDSSNSLNAAGVPVMAESGPNGGCRLVDGYRFPLRGLSADEAEALLLLGVPTAVTELGLAGALTAAQR